MIEREDHDSVAVLRFRHGKANALDTDFLNAISEELDSVARSDARAVVLTGTGSIFCAGVDLHKLVAGERPYLKTFFPSLTRAFRTVFELPLPVVAAVNGHAIAGGCVIACAADYRLACGGRIGVPELLVSVAYPTIALEILRFAVPRHRLQEVVYTGTTYEPTDALSRGLIDGVVPPDQLMDKALATAQRFAQIPTKNFAMTKQALRKPSLDRFKQEGGARDARAFEMWSSPETRDRIWNYLERVKSRKS